MITGAGAPGAPSIIRCLRKNGERPIRIVGVDMNPLASTRRMTDLFFPVPAAKDPMFLEKVMEICLQEKVDVIVPLVTRELYLFAEHKSAFEERGIRVSVMPLPVLKIVNNKLRLLTKMRELGMETPAFEPARTVDEVKTACKKLGYPENAVCVKSSEGNGSRGVRIIDAHKSHFDLLFNEKPNSMYMSYHDLIAALEEKTEIPEMMVMEFLPGEEYGVDALCDHGRVLCIAGRYNMAVNSSIPQASVVENREEPLKIAAELIEKLGMDGNVNFDFKYDVSGNARLIEINPRLSATITAYAPAGVNFPYLRVKQLLGEQISVPQVRAGVAMQRRYAEVFFDPNGIEIDW